MMSVIGDRSGVTVGDTIDAGWSHLGQCNAARPHVFPRAVLASLKSVETLTAVMRLWGWSSFWCRWVFICGGYGACDLAVTLSGRMR